MERSGNRNGKKAESEGFQLKVSNPFEFIDVILEFVDPPPSRFSVRGCHQNNLHHPPFSVSSLSCPGHVIVLGLSTAVCNLPFTKHFFSE